MRDSLPTEVGALDGLAYSLWLPGFEPWGAVVVIHGAGSCKENHHDFAAAARAAGMAALAVDLRGHGHSRAPLGAGVLDDLAAVAELLPAGVPRAARGSSMGGYLALVAAERIGAQAVVAICPASERLLLGGLRDGEYEFRADRPALAAFLREHALAAAVERLDAALLLLHAEADERVPVEGSRELARRARRAELVIVPGGHHRSVQHDPRLQARALRWLRAALA